MMTINYIYSTYIKRGIDIFLSLSLIPIVGLLIVPIGLAIKLDDQGSVFYRADRYGKNMRKFKMIKFRTMKMNAEDIRNPDGTTFNSCNDSRLTRVGRYLRESSLDELPQIFNILAGDMSFVGPRPSPMGNESTYTDIVKRKFCVRPGLTGLNQALNRNSSTLEERYNNDVYYALNCSLTLDLKIVILTIKKVIKHESIYTNK